MSLVFASTIFLSSFLLFLVQPLIAKQILPWFGGAAGVWTTSLLFFQAALLGGYAYSHFAVRKLSPRAQFGLHGVLLVASLAALPIIANPAWKPSGTGQPLAEILGLLAATVGLPYLMLSTTGPLVQAWFARTLGRVPYRLFALSNLGSLIALLAYPFTIEPWISTRDQAIGWSFAYGAFVLLCAASAWLSRKGSLTAAGDEPAPAGRTPSWTDRALWLALSAGGTGMLLAVSNHVTQNVASVPFLWIIPLSLYLLSFVISFDRPAWYRPAWWYLPLAALLVGMSWMLDSLDLKTAVPLYMAGLFAICMFCHGELYRSRPDASHLTEFYLMISAGGVVGGLLVAIAAPLAFHGLFELGIGLALVALLALVRSLGTRWWWTAGFGGVAVFAVYCSGMQIATYRDDTLHVARDFYGSLRVLSFGGPGNELRTLRHGSIMHGAQWMEPEEKRRTPISYYGEKTGLGLAIAALPADAPRKLGMIGLGSGTLAAYGRPGDTVRFYEISPHVADIARQYFRYIPEARSKVDIALGDARLSLEREQPQEFDLLAVDAFSGDAIPTHLLTAESMDLYLRHLKPGGVLLFHVTNRFLALSPVVQEIAKTRGLATLLVSNDPDDNDDMYYSRTDWVLVTRNAALLANPAIAAAGTKIEPLPGVTPWTDDFNNLYRILK